jgi:hypothetical protein
MVMTGSLGDRIGEVLPGTTMAVTGGLGLAVAMTVALALATALAKAVAMTMATALALAKAMAMALALALAKAMAMAMTMALALALTRGASGVRTTGLEFRATPGVRPGRSRRGLRPCAANRRAHRASGSCSPA